MTQFKAIISEDIEANRLLSLAGGAEIPTISITKPGETPDFRSTGVLTADTEVTVTLKNKPVWQVEAGEDLTAGTYVEVGEGGVLVASESTGIGYVAGAVEKGGLAMLVRKVSGGSGEKGPKGDKGATGTRGSRIWTSNNVTGTATEGTVFENSGITGALIYDYALNKSTGNLYVCSKAGDADVAEWKYDSNIKGPAGAKGADGKDGVNGKDAEEQFTAEQVTALLALLEE